MTGKPDEQALWRAIHRTPIIDNHAHPLLTRSALNKHPLLAVATEANGPALESSRRSLAHLRAVRQLAEALGIDEEAKVEWDLVEKHLREKQQDTKAYKTWTRQCLEGIECVLVDDGLDSPEDAESYGFFDEFTRGRSKRIVRIEPLLEEMIERYCTTVSQAENAFYAVAREFQIKIADALEDPEVVAFKSVICYRTGLAIRAISDEDAMDAFAGIYRERTSPEANKFTRLQHPQLNEYFVHQLALAIADDEGPFKKPIQFHTGLGDNDIILSKSSPAHMQDFIRTYPEVPLVLLHASYPFTRDLGYLTSVYANVYADVGEMFPYVSRHGQESVMRQILELAPVSKILWSTDGHWFPETYLLAVVQARQVLGTVLLESVQKRDMTIRQAVRLVEDVLFNNSNDLYNLGLKLEPMPVVSKHSGSITSREPVSQDSLAALSPFLGVKEEPRFLRIYWSDMTGIARVRVIPLRRVVAMLEKGEELSFGVTKASLGLTQLDMPAEEVSPSGEYRLHPDMGTLRSGPRKGHLSARGNFKEVDGAKVGLCPRTVLQNVLSKAKSMGIAFTLGFEVELVLMKRFDDEDEPSTTSLFRPLPVDGHCWSTGSAMDTIVAVEVIEEAVIALEESGIYVDMVHPESADGQYEIVLPKGPALEAVDTLLFARDVISYHAMAKGYKMTLHPKVLPDQCGTASHMHVSMSSLDGMNSPPDVYEPFYAGVLQHLPAASAYTLSTPASYDRAIDGCWAGGTWVAWGTQNRETPLRKIEGGHWEVKCIDGTANPYLATAAVLGSGLLGIESGAELSDWVDCGTKAPAGLTEEEREEMGITTSLPASCEQAWSSMRRDVALRDLMGRGLAERYIAVKVAESDSLKGLDTADQLHWMIERY